MTPRYAIGIDAGGSTVRAAVSDAAGTILAQSRGTAANPNAVGPVESVRQIRASLTTALAQAGVPAGDVGAVTVGLAGATRVLTDPAELATLQHSLRPSDLPVLPEVVLDVVAAFAAGSPEPSGRVVVAGTGSIAAVVADRTIRHRVGGWGWLLGDEGSGYWLGREAVRHVLAGGGGPLAAMVRRSYALDVPAADALLAAAYAAPPGRLATLGAAVAELAGSDPAADALVHRAAGHLLTLLDQLDRYDDGSDSVVLAGAVLAERTPVGNLIRSALQHRERPCRTAGPAVVGPTWLALRRLLGPAADPPVHARLTRTAAATTPAAASADCG